MQDSGGKSRLRMNRSWRKSILLGPPCRKSDFHNWSLRPAGRSCTFSKRSGKSRHVVIVTLHPTPIGYGLAGLSPPKVQWGSCPEFTPPLSVDAMATKPDNLIRSS